MPSPPSSAEHVPAAFTVASFNCLHGIDLRATRSNGPPSSATPLPPSPDLAAVADALAGLDADVITLQEVDRGLARSAGEDQIARLAADLGLYGVFAPALLGDPDRSWVPAPAADPGGGAYGVGVLSRHPIVRSARLRLPGGGAGERAGADGRPMAMMGAAPTTSAGGAAPEPTTRERAAEAPADVRGSMNPGWDREPRVALRVEIAHPAATVTVTTTHLSYLPWRSLRQLRAAARFAGGRPTADGPRSAPSSVRLLTGDFNLPARVAASVLPGWRRCAATATYPADDPKLQVDQIMVRGDAQVAASATLPPLTSDHLPVTATLAIGAP